MAVQPHAHQELHCHRVRFAAGRCDAGPGMHHRLTITASLCVRNRQSVNPNNTSKGSEKQKTTQITIKMRNIAPNPPHCSRCRESAFTIPE